MSSLFVVNFLFLCSCTTGSILQALQHTTQKLAVPVWCLPASSLLQVSLVLQEPETQQGCLSYGAGAVGSEVVYANRRLL